MASSICRALTGARLLLPSPSHPSLFSIWKPSFLPPCPSSSPTLIGFGIGVSQSTISGPAARAFSQHQQQTSKRRLVLYSKPECCLCENLKEKLNLALTIDNSAPSLNHSPLSDIQLEVRNITTNAEWEAAYQYEIPVLAWVNEDGTERILPRLSPRLSVELIQKKLLVTMSS